MKYLTQWAKSKDALTYDDFNKAIGDLDSATLKMWSDAKVSFFTHLARAGNMIYIPSGWCGMEQTCPGQSLVYGVRKSFFRATERDTKAFEACKLLLANSKRNVDRMVSIQTLMQNQLAPVLKVEDSTAEGSVGEPGVVEVAAGTDDPANTVPATVSTEPGE